MVGKALIFSKTFQFEAVQDAPLPPVTIVVACLERLDLYDRWVNFDVLSINGHSYAYTPYYVCLGGYRLSANQADDLNARVGAGYYDENDLAAYHDNDARDYFDFEVNIFPIIALALGDDSIRFFPSAFDKIASWERQIFKEARKQQGLGLHSQAIALDTLKLIYA
jgi:hypothetical protein